MFWCYCRTDLPVGLRYSCSHYGVDITLCLRSVEKYADGRLDGFINVRLFSVLFRGLKCDMMNYVWTDIKITGNMNT